MSVSSVQPSTQTASYADILRRVQQSGAVNNVREGTRKLVERENRVFDSLFPKTGIDSVDKVGQSAKLAKDTVVDTSRSIGAGGMTGGLCGLLIGIVAFGYRAVTVSRKWVGAIAAFSVIGGLMGGAFRAAATAKGKVEDFSTLLKR